MTELERLADDLAQEADLSLARVQAVTAKGALNVKNDWRRAAEGHPHLKQYPRSITYDTTVKAWGVEAEIGPDKSKPQGALGNLDEFGSVNNSPNNRGGQALQAEDPRFVAALEAIAGKSLR